MSDLAHILHYQQIVENMKIELSVADTVNLTLYREIGNFARQNNDSNFKLIFTSLKGKLCFSEETLKYNIRIDYYDINGAASHARTAAPPIALNEAFGKDEIICLEEGQSHTIVTNNSAGFEYIKDDKTPGGAIKTIVILDATTKMEGQWLYPFSFTFDRPYKIVGYED